MSNNSNNRLLTVARVYVTKFFNKNKNNMGAIIIVNLIKIILIN